MAVPRPLRRLSWDEALRPAGGSEILCSLAGPIQSGAKDAAGIAFQVAVLRQQGLLGCPKEAAQAAADAAAAAAAKKESEEFGTGAGANPDEDQPPAGVNWKGNKKKLKVKRKTEEDYYALLGLQHERWTATDAQLKLGYRKACLEHHPDKALVGVEDPEEKQRIEDRFKTIQDAYETLSDPSKRREFDSVDEFDDSLPTECAPADFFKVFAPAFRRNSRWSLDPVVPDVGDDNTSYAEVSKFYDFWYTFKSWREFPHPDEEDMEGAESREHKRWIERNNSKLREKAKKEETKRLREFVEAAYRLDPRVLKKRDDERNERERKKQEKEDARRKVIEEAEAAKAAAEAAKKAEEEEEKRKIVEARAIREAAKSVLKKERKRLRIACEGEAGLRLLSDDDFERLGKELDIEVLTTLNDAIALVPASDPEGRRHLLLDRLDELDQREIDAQLAKQQAVKQAEQALKNMAKKEAEQKQAKMAEWSDEELRMLDKSVAKFPQGTPKRWEQVTAYLRTRTLEEVLVMVKERKGSTSARLRQQEDWKAAQKKAASVTSAADLRCQAFTDVDVSLSGAAAKAAAQAAEAEAEATAAGNAGGGAAAQAAEAAEEAEAAAVEGDAASGTDSASDAGAASTAATVNGVGSKPSKSRKLAPLPEAASAVLSGSEQIGRGAVAKKPEKGAKAAKAEPTSPAKASAAAVPAKGVVSAESGAWSEAQEMALVQALKTFGKEVEDRWGQVATLVEGKSKAQCLRRFKELRSVFRDQKGEGSEGPAAADGAAAAGGMAAPAATPAVAAPAAAAAAAAPQPPAAAPAAPAAMPAVNGGSAAASPAAAGKRTAASVVGPASVAPATAAGAASGARAKEGTGKAAARGPRGDPVAAAAAAAAASNEFTEVVGKGGGKGGRGAKQQVQTEPAGPVEVPGAAFVANGTGRPKGAADNNKGSKGRGATAAAPAPQIAVVEPEAPPASALPKPKSWAGQVKAS